MTLAPISLRTPPVDPDPDPDLDPVIPRDSGAITTRVQKSARGEMSGPNSAEAQSESAPGGLPLTPPGIVDWRPSLAARGADEGEL